MARRQAALAWCNQWSRRRGWHAMQRDTLDNRGVVLQSTRRGTRPRRSDDGVVIRTQRRG